MKLQHPKGALEVREVIGYDVLSDGYLVRHDTKMRADQLHTTQSTADAGVSTANVKALRAWLADCRKSAAEVFASKFAASGVDHSESAAPPMPHGFDVPRWAQ